MWLPGVRRSTHFVHHLLEGHPPNEKEAKIFDVCGLRFDLDSFRVGGIGK
jgi:hypothetical protein